MTIRKTTQNILKQAQADAAAALVDIGKKYGLRVRAVAQSATAYRATMKVVVAVPSYREVTQGGRRIVFMAKRNPHQPGSKSARTYEALRKSATVEEFKAKAAKSRGSLYTWYANWAERPRDGRPPLIKLSSS